MTVVSQCSATCDIVAATPPVARHDFMTYGGRFGYFLFFSARGGGGGSEAARRGGGGRFFIENPRGGGL